MKKVVILLSFILILPEGYVHAFCFDEAGSIYNISPRLLWAIARVESGFRPDVINRNTDGSYDYGIMQINSSWEKTLGRNQWLALGDACYNVHVGAWILAQCVERHGYTWEAVGCYNSSKKEKRAAYARRIARVLEGNGMREQKARNESSSTVR